MKPSQHAARREPRREPEEQPGDRRQHRVERHALHVVGEALREEVDDAPDRRPQEHGDEEELEAHRRFRCAEREGHLYVRMIFWKRVMFWKRGVTDVVVFYKSHVLLSVIIIFEFKFKYKNTSP